MYCTINFASTCIVYRQHMHLDECYLKKLKKKYNSLTYNEVHLLQNYVNHEHVQELHLVKNCV